MVFFSGSAIVDPAAEIISSRSHLSTQGSERLSCQLTSTDNINFESKRKTRWMICMSGFCNKYMWHATCSWYWYWYWWYWCSVASVFMWRAFFYHISFSSLAKLNLKEVLRPWGISSKALHHMKVHKRCGVETYKSTLSHTMCFNHYQRTAAESTLKSDDAFGWTL